VGDASRPRLSSNKKVGGDGDPEVFVADEQGAVPLDVTRWSGLAERVLAAEGVRGNVELSVLFVEEDAISSLNEQFLGQDGPTDVLAFPIDAADAEIVSGPAGGATGPDRPPPDPGDLPLLLGDVVVCPAVAARQAPEHAGTLDDELALLVVHGILHVLGFDHAEVEEAERMRARERELLEAVHWHGAAPEAFRQEHR
jgi:probable rRNA maturation factor